MERFEKLIATKTGCRHAVATVNGTAALHVALQVAGIGRDDEVVMPSLTFIAPANAVRYLGAWPFFVDSDPDYWQMDVNQVCDFLKGCEWKNGRLRNRRTGRWVRALLPVHILGHPVDMGPLVELAQTYNLVVVEDATESLGARYKTRSVGQLGHIACFSFNGNKIITTGGGGMIVTDTDAWADRARSLSTQARDDPVEYIHSGIGYNYRLTNLQAAVGCAQLEKLDAHVTAKRAIGAFYHRHLGGVPGLSFMQEAPWARSVYWMSTVLVNEREFRKNSRDLMQCLAKSSVQTRPLWQPMHLSTAHAGSDHMPCPVAERLWRDGLSLPCSVGLTRPEQDRVVAEIALAAPAGEKPCDPCQTPV